MDIYLQPVAFVKNTRTDLSDDFWGSVVSEIELVETIPAEAFKGIDEFSHLEIIFHFDQSDKTSMVYSGHPRGNKNWPHTGIFAQRKKDRPNALGLTIVELVKREGNKIWVKYLDAINGTPILDIKPVMKEFLPAGKIRQPKWSIELMKDYWS
ncbi:MAG: tRNA (N6-threonylcarbamoyladenosine(37)-N6)-methyltransferase TrmO [Chitinophagaceae bacterium]|nr:tRNA (N6-threonylcarbamoyladenosine(37)-N6)-methyltransferase TrmO [Chitinophagaceae bacterium]MBL0132408.1 tRNA (N6-threonylcarbamoyladenosine(37)-N6)-methyltransferase TrmO [Chitinophagaceae bacterium]MBL0271564.1 tRNA (N6-threonylcarbamoyladenosine(37)-N6)-methyltransferase TrmO [Chitinophagaceae bacterium]